jgi:hypothetical protein
MGSRLDEWIYWHFLTITTNQNSSQSMVVYDLLHSLLDHERLLFYCDERRTMNPCSHTLNCLLNSLYDSSLSLMLRPTAIRPVCLGIKHPSEAYDQIFITVKQLQVCWCGALSLTRRWVCLLQMLLALASAVILGSQSRGTRDHILLSQIRDFPFCRLLRLARSRWRYSNELRLFYNF